MNQIVPLTPPPRPGRRKDARVERTREYLRSGLLRLLEEQSFDRVTIRNICARAGVGYATYFRHYPDKSALLSDLAAAEVSELLRRALPILFDVDSRAACVTLCSYVHEKRELWLALLTGGAAGTLRREFARQSQDVSSTQPDSQPPGRIPADLGVAFGVSSVVEILSWWLQHGEVFTLDEIADILNRLVVAPILQR